MKKTRILASLLCIMMIVCALPVMHVSAANTGVNDPALMSAIANVMGYDIAVPAATTTTWAAVNMDFGKAFDSSTTGVSGNGVTYDEDGINFPAGDTAVTWNYIIPNTTANKDYPGWSPLCVSYNYTFRFKLDEGGELKNYAARIWGTDNKGVDFTATPEKIEFLSNGNVVRNPDRTPVSYVPGTEWNDVLVKYIMPATGLPDNKAGYEIWMKKSTDASFEKLGAGASFSAGPQWAATGLMFMGKSAHIMHAVSAKAYTGTYYNTVEEIAGAPVAVTHDFNLNDKSSMSMYNHTTGAAGIYYQDANAKKGSYTKDGYLGESWRFCPYENWVPLSSDGTETMFGFTSKTETGFTVEGGFKGTTNTRISLTIKPGVNIASNTNNIAHNSPELMVGTDWTDYLVKQYNTNGNYGYQLFMKNDATNNKWVSKAIVTLAAGSSWAWRGIMITDRDGSTDTYLKNVRVYTKSGVTADEDTVPETATKLYFEENFNSTPTYPNYVSTGSNTKYDSSVAAMWEGVSEPADIVINNAGIPKGGYAEIRLSGDASPYGLTFSDGISTYQIEYSMIEQTSFIGTETNIITIAENNTDYRTWRIVHNADDTYSAYTKVDGESNWYAAQVNQTAKPATTNSMIKLDANVCYGTLTTASGSRSGGIMYIDYVKVYGPEDNAILTLTDGYGTKILDNNCTLTFASALRPIVNSTGKLLVVTYKGEDMLKAQIVDAASIGDMRLVDTTASGATKVKVFLWSGFDNLNSLTPAVTLNL